MATRQLNSRLVRSACFRTLDWIESERDKKLAEMISNLRKETHFSLFKMRRVHSYLTDEAALNHLKTDDYGSAYYRARQWGWTMEQTLNSIAALCIAGDCTPVTLTEDEFAMIKRQWREAGWKTAT